jgi:hypothetical protein
MAKKIYIKSHDIYVTVDDEDYRLLSAFNWYGAVSPQKSGIDYVSINACMDNFRMSRLIMGVLYQPNVVVDHIDHDIFNMTKANLRVCTKADNAKNRAKGFGKHLTSQYKGVYWDRRGGTWRAGINNGEKWLNLGTFDNEHEAAYVYNENCKKYHGEFAHLNILKGALPEVSTRRGTHRVKGPFILHKEGEEPIIDKHIKNLTKLVDIKYAAVIHQIQKKRVYDKDGIRIEPISEK